MSAAILAASALLRLADAELSRAFEGRYTFNPVPVYHPAPPGTPGGAGLIQSYQVQFSYPGRVLVFHMSAGYVGDLVAASEPGRPDVLALDHQAALEDPPAWEARRALLHKARAAVFAECGRRIASRPLPLGQVEISPGLQATFEWPGVLQVTTADGSATLAISLPGQPLQLDTHAMRAAAHPGDH